MTNTRSETVGHTRARKAPLSTAVIRDIAHACSADPASVRRAVVDGRAIRGLAGYRIRAELERRGLLALAPGLAALTVAPTYLIAGVGSGK
jgi:hypothetical protein